MVGGDSEPPRDVADDVFADAPLAALLARAAAQLYVLHHQRAFTLQIAERLRQREKLPPARLKESAANAAKAARR